MASSRSALQKAISLLARRDYSAHQLRHKLSSRFSTQEIGASIERLLETGLLDDERMALERARLRRESQLWGDLKLRADLARIGIDDRISERVLEVVGRNLGESESLERLTSKWIATHGAPASRRVIKRLFDYCLRRGYPADLIRSKLDIWWERLKAE